MMKSSFLVCCLVLSVSAAPAPEAKPEPDTKGGAAAKLQFASEDAQQSFYSQSVSLPEQQTVIRVAESPRNILKSVAQSPLYIAAPAGPRPYSNSRTTITTTGQAGQLPDGYVYEHHGESHIGHTSQAIHVKKQGALSYAVAAPSVSVTGLRILPQAPQINSYASSADSQSVGQISGQIAIIDGRQAIQQKNGQWLWLNQAAPASSGSWSSGSWNSAWNSKSVPQYQTVSIAAAQPKTTLVYAQQQPQTVTIARAAPQPQTVVYAQEQPQQQTVVYAQEQPQTVTIAQAAPQPQTIVYSQEQPQQQTVTLIEKQQPQQQTVVYAQEQPQQQAVVYAQEQPQTVTLVARRQPQTVTIARPAPQPQAVVYTQEQPQQQTVTIAREQPAIQTVKTYTTEAARPAIDSKWYTKTNKAVIQPFYAQAPQYVEIAQASQSTKQLAAAKPESEDEKDW